VLKIYAEAAERGWVIPCFCTENLTTTEAILAAVSEYGRLHSIDNLPVTIGITNRYTYRSQTSNYTNTGIPEVGLSLFLSELDILTRRKAPFENLRVMVHLDHIQPDEDDILGGDFLRFSSIMFDASALPFEENIRRTRLFVDENRENIVVEGACDEISPAGTDEDNTVTTADKAVRYLRETGVDLIVANLGTEHRAKEQSLSYRDERAREIKTAIGTKLVLHGTSSVPVHRVGNLFNDGICKVNIWTALERDSVPVLFRDMLCNASKVVGRGNARALHDEDLLGTQAGTGHPASIDYFTTHYRQRIIFREMKNIVTGYVSLWYNVRE